MFKLIIALSMLISSASFAFNNETDAELVKANVSFGYYNNDAHYACSYAEAQAKKHLKALGASNVSTKCHGGIDTSPHWAPLSLSVTFEGLKAVDAATETSVKAAWDNVVLKGKEACEFNVKLIETLVGALGATVVDEYNSCWDASGRYSFEISTLKAL